MSTTSTNTVTEILTSLYAEGVSEDANWEKLTAAGVEDLPTARAETGDSALQTLMGQLALDKAESPEQAQRIATALAGIKQFMVHEILEELPTTSIEDLRAAADKAGYDLEIIG